MRKSHLKFGVSLACLLAASLNHAAAQQVADASDSIESITIFAKGETRQTQSIDAQMMQDVAPGTSPIKAISELPGVNYTSADSFGAYEWATRISVRGFNQNQLGFTLDDVPLGDMSYGNWNGLHISRAIIDENLGVASISQGAGSLATASNSNLGGTLQFNSLPISDKFEATVAQTFGSDSAFRTFARMDSGLLSTGTKFSVSVANQDSDKWRGIGQQKDLQVNGKVVQNVGEGTLTAFLNYSDRAEVDYQDVSKEYVNKLGYAWDNYGNWGEAIKAAQGYQAYLSGASAATVASYYSHGEATTSDPFDAAYYGGSGLRKDWLGGVTLAEPITDNFTLKTTFYGHHDDGRGLWFTPYTSSPDGSPIALRTSEYTQGRWGGITEGDYSFKNNELQVGFWYEKEYFDLARRYYETSLTDPIQSLYDFPSNPFHTDWAFHFDTDVIQGFVQDTYHVTDNVTLFAGFKGTDTQIKGKQVQGSGYASGTVDSSDGFLPQAGFNWQAFGDDEVFGDVAKNMRSFQAGGPGYAAAPFQMTQAVFNQSIGSLKPETSWTEELGYRFKHGPVSGDLVVYHVDFSNRLLAIAQCAGIVGCANALANVGSVNSNGAELAVTWKVMPHVSWYNSATFDRSLYGDSLTSGGVTYDTKGKQTVDTPEWMWKSEISYENEGFFAHLSADYMSTRYYSYTADAGVDGRVLFDTSMGYVFDKIGPLHDARIQFNVTNLLDKKYYASVGTNGFVISDPSGTAQTLQVGAPRAFFGTISAKF